MINERPARDLLTDAIRYATSMHQGQLDKSNRPYILHLLRVMIEVAKVSPDDYEAQIVAVMHDLIEDTETTLAHLQGTFPQRVVDALDAISQRRGEETYRQYIRRCKLNELARWVKIRDIYDNLSEGRRYDGDRGMRERYDWALYELGK